MPTPSGQNSPAWSPFSLTTEVTNGEVVSELSQPAPGQVQADLTASEPEAETRIEVRADKFNSRVQFDDADGTPNLRVEPSRSELKVRNPGQGVVESRLDLAEADNDGSFENVGRWVANLFTEEIPVFVGEDVPEASSVRVTRNREGETWATAKVNGDDQVVFSSPGDTDDTWIERVGERADNFLKDFFG